MSLHRYSKGVNEVDSSASVTEACMRMRDHSVGALVVLEGARPIGILTDRDVALRVVAEGRDPAQTLVEEAMSPTLYTLPDTSSLEEASELMRDHGLRRVPLTDPSGRITGLVSFDDVVLLLGMELGNLASALFKGRARELSETVRPPG